MHQQLAQFRPPRRLEGDQFVVELLQPHGGHQLRRIGDDAALDQRGIEAFDHAVLGDVEDAMRLQKCNGRLSTAKAASCITSESVGWA